jgi:hypothetical protein
MEHDFKFKRSVEMVLEQHAVPAHRNRRVRIGYTIISGEYRYTEVIPCLRFERVNQRLVIAKEETVPFSTLMKG